MIIIGAGHAGLMAGNLIQDSEVHEIAPGIQPHRAVLRFRTPAVGDALGIPFKKVTVRKGIWVDGKFAEPNIRLANLYSQKVTGGNISDRSIWNIETADRWIAPEDFSEIMVKRLGKRIHFNSEIELFPENREPIISTMPMKALESALIGDDKIPDFKSWPIFARRFRVKGASSYQTVYFPTEPRLYRATLTGDLLSVEFIEADSNDYECIHHAFGIDKFEFIDEGWQINGKLMPIDEKWRRMFILGMTRNCNIYSLGRFATWRNILLDDVLKDISVIKKMISSDDYEKARSI